MKDDKPDAPTYTRLEYMRLSWEPEWINDDWVTQEFYDEQAAQYVPELPPIDDAVANLVGYMMEIGPVVAAGMGIGPNLWREMKAWKELTATHLSPNDARLLHRMIMAYHSESQKATKHFYPPPWWPEGVPRPLTKEQAEKGQR